MSICFPGLPAVGKNLALKALLPLLEEGGMAPLRLQDRLPGRPGTGRSFSAWGYPVTGLSRGHLPGSFSCLQPVGALGLGGPIEAGHPGHRDCRTLPPLFPGHAAHGGRMCWTAPPAAGRRDSWAQCSPRRTLWCSPRSTWSPRRNWRSSPGRSGRSTPERRFFRWTVWRAMEPTFWPGGCWTGLRAAALRGTFCGTPCPAGSAPTAWEAACGQRIPAGRGGQDQL